MNSSSVAKDEVNHSTPSVRIEWLCFIELKGLDRGFQSVTSPAVPRTFPSSLKK